MLSKCANPLCFVPFRYLHEGRIFNIELGAPPVDPEEPPILRIEHFWLCARCVQTLKVVLDHGVFSTRSLHLELPESAPEDELEEESHLV